MSLPLARVVLHTVHLLAFLVLVATGVLLMTPSLRAAITGGYAVTLALAHKWASVGFVVLPAALLAWVGPHRLFAPPPVRTLRSYLQALHIGITVLLTLAFTGTGLVLWARRAMPLEILDPAQALHDSLTYIAIALFGTHLADVAVSALTARIRPEPLAAGGVLPLSKRSPDAEPELPLGRDRG